MENYKEVVEQRGAHCHQLRVTHESSTDHRGLVHGTTKSWNKQNARTGSCRSKDWYLQFFDCEECEWKTYPSFFSVPVEWHQVLIALHTFPQALDFLKPMYQNGYGMFTRRSTCTFGMSYHVLNMPFETSTKISLQRRRNGLGTRTNSKPDENNEPSFDWRGRSTNDLPSPRLVGSQLEEIVTKTRKLEWDAGSQIPIIRYTAINCRGRIHKAHYN